MKKLFTLNNILLALLLIIFTVRAIIALDPDFGWRLRTGFYILENGVPKTDLYSYTMPSFSWVDHAWLTDILIASIYFLSGKAGLSFVFSILCFLALIIASSSGAVLKNRNKYWPNNFLSAKYLGYIGNPAFLLSAAILLVHESVRVQVLSWLFLSIFLKFIFSGDLWKKYRLFTPIFFLVWANLHGGFTVGLSVFAAVLMIRSFLKRKIETADLIIFIFSLFITLLNPYGFGVYREVWSSISDSKLHRQIQEWMPFYFSFNFPFLILMTLSSVLIFKYRSKLNIDEVTVYLCLLLQALISVRNIPLWVLAALPLTDKSIEFFNTEISKNKVSLSRFKRLYFYFWLFSLFVFCTQAVISFREAILLSEKYFYPAIAIDFLRENPQKGEIFSHYGWGGYLIWKLPEKKVFIDGRMPSWKQTGGQERESKNVMEEYMQITRGESDYNGYFQKYNVNTVLWPVKPPETVYNRLEDMFGDSLKPFYKILGIKNTDFFLSDKLKENGWKKIHSDNISEIFISP